MSERHSILKANDNIRRGNGVGPRQLDDGEVAFAIPTEDYDKLKRVFPELFSLDAAERNWAWRAFRDTPLGEHYMVQRTPRQVRRSTRHGNRGIIIK